MSESNEVPTEPKLERRTRRRFSAAEKQSLLAKADALAHGSRRRETGRSAQRAADRSADRLTTHRPRPVPLPGASVLHIKLARTAASVGNRLTCSGHLGLRFYFDFRGEYGHDRASEMSFGPYSKKLEARGQEAGRRRQALDEVKQYLRTLSSSGQPAGSGGALGRLQRFVAGSAHPARRSFRAVAAAGTGPPARQSAEWSLGPGEQAGASPGGSLRRTASAAGDLPAWPDLGHGRSCGGDAAWSGREISPVDDLMSGLALLGLELPSLLQFEHDRHEETTRANVKARYGIERLPSDTRFRDRLDALDPRCLHPLYEALFGQLQRGEGPEGPDYLDGHDLPPLVSIDHRRTQRELLSGATAACGHHGPGYNRELCGCSSMVEPQLPKLMTWVRFPSPAPIPPPLCSDSTRPATASRPNC